MKTLALIFLLSIYGGAHAEVASALFRKSSEVTYDAQTKGLRELVVDLVNPALTKQLNDQMIFGHLNEVVFRIYWTAKPERVAVEIEGLPEGFREIKDELRAAMVGSLEYAIAPPIEKKFAGYTPRMELGKNNIVFMDDPTHLRPVLGYELGFEADGKLIQVMAKKPVGIVLTKNQYGKEAWSDGRYVLQRSETIAEEGPQVTQVTTQISYQAFAGIGLPVTVRTLTKQVVRPPGGNPEERLNEDVLTFKNHKVNDGSALKWFLGHATAK